MYEIDLSRPCNAYFVGIGGVSMSGLYPWEKAKDLFGKVAGYGAQIPQ